MEDPKKVWFASEVFERLFTRDADGNRLSVDWGEPDEDGFYEPTITIDYDDNIAHQYKDAALRYGTFTMAVLTALKKCGIVGVVSIDDGIDDNARMN